jgi:hypothetical protein
VRALDRGQRVAARTLYRSADRIYALPANAWSEAQRLGFARERAELRLANEPGEATPTLVVGAGGAVTAAPWAA